MKEKCLPTVHTAKSSRRWPRHDVARDFDLVVPIAGLCCDFTSAQASIWMRLRT